MHLTAELSSFFRTDRREDIARRDLQGAAEAVLALGDGANELLVAWIDAKAPPCGIVTQGAGEDRVRVGDMTRAGASATVRQRAAGQRPVRQGTRVSRWLLGSARCARGQESAGGHQSRTGGREREARWRLGSARGQVLAVRQRGRGSAESSSADWERGSGEALPGRESTGRAARAGAVVHVSQSRWRACARHSKVFRVTDNGTYSGSLTPEYGNRSRRIPNTSCENIHKTMCWKDS